MDFLRGDATLKTIRTAFAGTITALMLSACNQSPDIPGQHSTNQDNTSDTSSEGDTKQGYNRGLMISLNNHLADLADLIELNDVIPADALAEMVNGYGSTQEGLFNLAEAVLNDPNTNNLPLVNELLEGTAINVVNSFGELNADMAPIFNQAGIDNPISALSGTLVSAYSQVAALNASSDPTAVIAAIENLSAVNNNIALAVQSGEMALIANSLVGGSAELQQIIDGLGPVATLAAPANELLGSMSDIGDDLMAGDLNSAISQISVLANSGAIETFASLQGIDASEFGELSAAVASIDTANLDDIAERQDAIRRIADVVDFINEVLLGLLGESLDASFDPLVGAILTTTNLLDNIAGTNGNNQTVIHAAAGELSANQAAAVLGETIAEFNEDLFTQVFPLNENAPGVFSNIASLQTVAANLPILGLDAMLNPINNAANATASCDISGDEVTAAMGFADSCAG